MRQTVLCQIVVTEVDLTNQTVALLLRLQDAFDYGNGSNVSQFVLVDVELAVAEVDYVQTWMVLHDALEVRGMLRPAQLIVLHDELNQPVILPDSLNYRLEVLLELIA